MILAAPGRLRAAQCALLIMASTALAGAPPPDATATLDHVIVGVADLEHGIEELTRRTGVAPAVGGRHPGRGTRNALLSLGPRTYLELLAPSDEADEKTRSSFAPFTEPRPMGWAIGTTDLDQIARQLRSRGMPTSDPVDGSRLRPDGGVLKWRTAEPSELHAELKPFFIQWSTDTVHPATTSPRGCRLESLAVTDPVPEALQSLVGALGVSVAVLQGTPAAMRIVLACPRGRVELGGTGS